MHIVSDVQSIHIETSNRDFFRKLQEFGDEIITLCEGLGIQPFTYGSVAYLAHTEDSEIEVSDIDFLVPESDFDKIIASLRTFKELKVEKTTYNTLKISKNELKISFDSIAHYLVGLQPSFQEFALNGIHYKIIDSKSLIEVYRRGADLIPIKRDAYERKLLRLKKAIGA